MGIGVKAKQASLPLEQTAPAARRPADKGY